MQVVQYSLFFLFQKKTFTSVHLRWADWRTSWLCAGVTGFDFCREWNYRGFGGDIRLEILDARSRQWTIGAHSRLPWQRYTLCCHLYGVHPLRRRGRSLHAVEAVLSRQVGGVRWVGVVFLEARRSRSSRCRSFPEPIDWWVDFQAFAHLWHGWRNSERGLSLWYTWRQYPIWIHHVKTVTFDSLVLQGGPLVIHDTVAHAELTMVGLLHVLVLVGLLMLLQMRLELVLMLWQRQDYNTGDVPWWGPQGQVCRYNRRAYRWHILCASIDEILISFPLPAATAGLATWLHGCGFRRWQSSEIQVVLVCFYQHLAIWCQSPIVHQRGEDCLGATIFGLCLKQTCQFGHTVHGSPAGMEVVAVLFLAACHVYVSPPVVTDTIDNDAREDGTHRKGKDDSNSQQSHGN